MNNVEKTKLMKLKKLFAWGPIPTPLEEINEELVWIEKPGIKNMRYLEVYESDLDIFLDAGWEVCD